jgi:hypothetical protein
MRVCTKRSEGRCIWLGPQGRRGPIRRLERSLRGLRRAVEHVAEGQGNNRGLPKGVLEEVMGSCKNFTISELGYRGGCQKTITPSSLRYEDQVECRLPLATLRVVLRNQLLKAGRPHPNVDVGWPAAVGDGVLVPPPRGERHRSLLPGPFGFSRPLRL